MIISLSKTVVTSAVLVQTRHRQITLFHSNANKLGTQLFKNWYGKLIPLKMSPKNITLKVVRGMTTFSDSPIFQPHCYIYESLYIIKTWRLCDIAGTLLTMTLSDKLATKAIISADKVTL